MAAGYEVETPIGTLFVEPEGDAGVYDGLTVSLRKPDGSVGSVAWVEVETFPDGTHELHTLAFDGDDGEPAVKVVCDPDGREMSYN